MIETSNAQPVGIAAEEAAAAEYLPEAYKLTRLPDIINGPVASPEIVKEAWFTGFTANDPPAFVTAGLEKLLEMQRHSLYDDGISWIGGWGQFTTIHSDGRIEQRILQRWNEEHEAKRVGAAVATIPEGFSRLQNAWKRKPVRGRCERCNERKTALKRQSRVVKFTTLLASAVYEAALRQFEQTKIISF